MAPAAPRCLAIDAPMPLDAPVTSAILFASLLVVVLLLDGSSITAGGESICTGEIVMFPLFLIGEVILSGGIVKVVASIKSQCQPSQ
ncbi:hypothetical protein [Nostoc sp.]